MRTKLRAFSFEDERLKYKDFACLGNTNSARMKKLVSALRFCIDEDLSPRQREMVELLYFEGLSKPMIAKKLGVNKTTVYRTIMRAEGKIRKRLELLVRYK